MANYNSSSELIMNELLRITKDFIWKNPDEVSKYEENCDSIEVEQYLLAVQGNLSFDLIHKFDEEVFLEMGIDGIKAIEYANNAYAIPDDIRNICTEKQIQYIIDTYEECNDYYRMLNGLPALDDEDYIYNTKYMEISDDNTPIHELSISQLYSLEANGYLDSLREKYPDKKYLNHLTSKKIDIYTARKSDNYAILWITGSGYSSLLSEFKETYNLCRQMVLNVYYIKSFDNTNKIYGGFVGLVILFATLIHMNYKILDTDITRDFFDEDSLRYVYDSYGVPFYASIPMEYHKKIVKNINILISHKGSTKVFYDLFDIFGFESTGIFEYYMLKLHRFEDGKPVFAKNSDGTYNNREMYDVKFSKVLLYNNPSAEVKDTRNHVEYEDMISTDPYWISDKELLDKIYNEEYNYLETKYLGIQTTFNLMKIMYECTYYIKMIIDNRELLSSTMVFNNSTRSYCNIFDLVIYESALLCQKYGFEGNIPSDPHEIGKVLGFNFKDGLSTLINNINENDYLEHDEVLLNYLTTMDVSSLESIQNVYTNLTSLRKYIIDKMHDTDDTDEYWSYYELYQSIMYSEYVDGVFKKSNGENAISFADLLSDINASLFARLNSDTEVDKDTEISNVLYLIKSSCDALSNIQYADNVNINTILEYLFKLLEFFKSSKAELTGYEIIYSLIMNGENTMKLMTLIDRIFDDHTSDPQYSIIDELYDLIDMIKDKTRLKDQVIKLVDESQGSIDYYKVSDLIDYLTDYIDRLSDIVYLSCKKFILLDVIEDYREITILDGDRLLYSDSVSMLHEELKTFIQYVISDEGLPLSSKIFEISDIVYQKDSRDVNKIMFVSKLIDYTKMKNMNSNVPISDDLYQSSIPISYYNLDASFISKLIEYMEELSIEFGFQLDDIFNNISQIIYGISSDVTLSDNEDDIQISHQKLLYSLYENTKLNFMEIVKYAISNTMINTSFKLKDSIHKESDKNRRNDSIGYIDLCEKISDNEKSYDHISLSDKLILRFSITEQ